MTADAQGMDLGAVSIPITGSLAVCFEVTAENVLTDKLLGASPIQLSAEKWKHAGLFKQDGGLQTASESEDALEFFQQGYAMNGARTDSITIGMAEENEVVRRLTYGKQANSDGVIYVDTSNPDALLLGVSITRFKNGTEERRHGVLRVSEIETDQEERGSVRGRNVTFQWVPHVLFNDSPYKVWFGKPGASVEA